MSAGSCLPTNNCPPTPHPHPPVSATASAYPTSPPHRVAFPQVQGAEEAQKERQRQKDLESNYRRVWGSPGGEGTGDLDEFDF